MNSVASEPTLIGIDWGTSSVRAYLIGAHGDVLDRVVSSEGIMHVAGGKFETVFCELVVPWITDRKLPILASGMITSRNGWIETPYRSAPVGADDLAHDLLVHRSSDGVELHFVPGVTTDHESGPDVMRGEETQVIGASALGLSDGLFVLPGTHSKWIRVSASRIEDHATFMTGEVFAALKDHTILGALAEDGPFDAAGFDRGVTAGLKERSSLLHDLFHVRTLPLTGQIEGTMVADYLSGMLIGAEIAAGIADSRNTGSITIVGKDDLAARYEIALRHAGVTSRRAPEDIVAMGHFAIARAAGLLA